jgi:hypothetical protein
MARGRHADSADCTLQSISVNGPPSYRDPLVRDLYWALSSPPLLQIPNHGTRWIGPVWFSDITQDFTEQFERLDKDPRPLRDRVLAQKDRRLGKYFEALWRFWLDTNTRYRLLHANLSLRSAARTLGEFDLLVTDTLSGKTLHWELAVKFYLGVGDTARAGHWWGPGRRDRLDLKTRHLIEHQSRLSQHPLGRQLLDSLHIRIDETWVILKGRLFYPLGRSGLPPHQADPAHLKGFWAEADGFRHLEQARWAPLSRQQWLAPLSGIAAAECLGNTALLDRWRQQDAPRPLCVARIREGVEKERGFLVPDGWAARPADPG